MAKQKESAPGLLIRAMFQLGIYKRSQGRMTRQLTFFAVLGSTSLASYRLHMLLGAMSLGNASSSEWSRELMVYVLPMMMLVGGGWIAFRLVNWPRFADFLIAVEAEMNKVSWPDRPQLTRSSLVVLITIFLLSIVLFGYDVTWKYALDKLGVTRGTSTGAATSAPATPDQSGGTTTPGTAPQGGEGEP